MIAGALEIQMFSNMARLTQDMAQAKTVVGGAMDKIQRSVNAAKTVLGALGASIGIVTFTRIIKSSIDAQDELSKLSQKVGISVESLAGLKHAGELSGLAFESLQKGIKSVSTQMFDAASGLLESKRNFAALGIEVKNTDGSLKSAERVMVEVANRFAIMKDGTEKSALAVKLFGKAGLDMIPMLNEGGDALAAMVAEGQKLNPVTAESAKQAEIFNDSMDRLGKSVSSLTITILNDFLPAMSQMTKIFSDAALSADGFWKSAAGFALTGGDETAAPWKAIEDVSDSLARQKKMLAELEGSWASFFNADDIAILKVGIAANEAKLAYLKALRASDPGQTDPGFIAPPKPKGSVTIQDTAADAAAAKRLAKLEREQKERQRILDQYQKADNDRWVKDIEEQFKRDADAEMREHDKAVRKEERRIADMESLRASLLTEEELERESYVKRLAVLIESNEAKEISDGEMMVIREEMEEAHQKRLLDIIMRTGTAQRKWEVMNAQQRVQSVLGELISMTDGVAQQSRAMFEINKAASIAQAIISTYEGAQKAFSAMSGIPIIGPALGAAAAAVAIGAGLARVAAIKSTTFGGSSSPSLAGSTAAPPVSIAQPAQAPLTQSQQSNTPREVRIQINSSRNIFSRSDLEEIFSGLNEVAADGFPTRFTLDAV